LQFYGVEAGQHGKRGWFLNTAKEGVMRRTLLLAALLASGATLLAQGRATLIMNNGERLSGTLVSRTFAAASRSNVLLNVNNRNMQVPLGDVAVIDFAGGRPSARELDDVAPPDDTDSQTGITRMASTARIGRTTAPARLK
jgi:hypothetical protein